MGSPTKGYLVNTDFKNLIYKEEGDLATIVLNRPKSLNALSIELSDEFVGAVELVRQSEDLKYLLIYGANDNFCVGDDITEMFKWGNANDVMRRVRYYQNMANPLVRGSASYLAFNSLWLKQTKYRLNHKRLIQQFNH